MPGRIRTHLTAMTIFGWLIFALWLTLVAYWGLSAYRVRRSTGGRWLWWREIAVRLGFFALVVLTLQITIAGNSLPNDARLYAFTTNMLRGLIGLVLCLLGVGLAIAARPYLRWNCGTPMAGDEVPELVTRGPYALVRHPIYGGMLLAMLGSAIGQSLFWLLPLVVYGPLFIRSARREEEFLTGRFPERYRAYMKRTKMLLPFVL